MTTYLIQSMEETSKYLTQLKTIDQNQIGTLTQEYLLKNHKLKG